MAEPESLPKKSLHAWLTLPDLTIIDVTLLTALKSVGKYPNLDYRNFWIAKGNKGKSVNDKYCFQPLLLGDKYLERTFVEE